MLLYRLADPRTGETKYVGQTKTDIDTRLRRHRKHSVTTKSWLADLADDGLEPEIEILEEVNSPGSHLVLEEYWMFLFLVRGNELLNGNYQAVSAKKRADEVKLGIRPLRDVEAWYERLMS